VQQRALLLALWRSPLQCPVIGIESLLVLLPPEQAVALVLQLRQLQRALRLGTATQLDSADMPVTPWPRLLPGSVRTIDSSKALASLCNCSAPRLLCQASRASSERTLPHQALAVTRDTANTLSEGMGLEVLISASAQATVIPVRAGTRPELANGACQPGHCPTQEGLHLVNRRYGLWTRGRPPRARLGLAYCNPAPHLQVPASKYSTTAATPHNTLTSAGALLAALPGHTIDETAGAVVAEIKATPEVFL